MMSHPFFSTIQKGLIVSCQALEGEPLYGADTMAKMSKAAEIGGAVGIRANSVQDIEAIKRMTKLPIIGIIKRDYKDSDIFITPTMKEINELLAVGIDIIALDATNRTRPGGEALKDLIQYLKKQGQLVMADISTLEEALVAEELGADCVSTTLSGYTPYSRQEPGPDFALVKEAVGKLHIPVIAEGKISTPDEALLMLNAGAHAVVVGSAITRPQLITERYAAKIRKGQHVHGFNG
ncbi:N-acetylmannosamine-6-phosphate 2-epimerase [Paenibacillus caui]|uniref:N-acetylmannosamine-6-phosphate 2-epimerase n=1 Tax=Paenibacillus caui TaxID=2873927 RepID=UPI001F45C95E|nr:N-acetylmannosamine-6-phosphate 2-epimerase [Paenibacillus caui]